MAMPKVKFSFTIEKLSFSFEGDQTLGQHVQQQMQESLNGIAETQLRVLGIEQSNGNNGAVIDGTATPAKRRKRRTAVPAVNGNGASADGRSGARAGSVRSIVEQLITEGFFATEKKVSEVSTAMSNRGRNAKSNEISMVLLKLTQDQKLNRRQDGKVYLYVNKT